ncbi:MAG: mononuclear molybdenum enzyme YedY, partial [Gammaproteobacteria bacterium]|nr:mononuclear molybdenum enzyme YedY [Gammaproteobacteria bacterium]
MKRYSDPSILPSAITPEHEYFDRRRLLAALAASAAMIGGGVGTGIAASLPPPR